MKVWIASLLLFSFVFAIFLSLILAQISNNAVEDEVHSEFCCNSHGGCPNGIISECQTHRDDHWEYRWSDSFRDGIVGAIGLGMFLVLFMPFRKQRLWNRVIPGSVLLPLSLCLIGAQLYVWIWHMPLFNWGGTKKNHWIVALACANQYFMPLCWLQYS